MSRLREFIDQSKENQFGSSIPRNVPSQKTNFERTINHDMYVHRPSEGSVTPFEDSSVAELTSIPEPEINPNLVQVQGRRGVDHFGDRIYSHPTYPGVPVDLIAPTPVPRSTVQRRTFDEILNEQRRKAQYDDASSIVKAAEHGADSIAAPKIRSRSIPAAGPTVRQRLGRTAPIENITIHHQANMQKDFNLVERPNQHITYRNIGYIPTEEFQAEPKSRNTRLEKLQEQQALREQRTREERQKMDSIYAKIVSVKNQ